MSRTRSHTCRCGANWRGLRPAHCSVCHVTFSGVWTFDNHRKRTGCATPEACGYVNRDDVWGSAAKDTRFGSS